MNKVMIIFRGAIVFSLSFMVLGVVGHYFGPELQAAQVSENLTGLVIGLISLLVVVWDYNRLKRRT